MEAYGCECTHQASWPRRVASPTSILRFFAPRPSGSGVPLPGLEAVMCVFMLVLGALVLVIGTAAVIRFFVGHGAHRAEVASVARTETMLLGVAAIAIGFLLLVFGVTGTVCQVLGIG